MNIKPRSARILMSVANGTTLAGAGKPYNISRQRVYQIVTYEAQKLGIYRNPVKRLRARPLHWKHEIRVRMK